MKYLALLLTVLTLSSCSRDNDSKKPTDNKVYSFTDNPAIIGEWEAKYPEKEYSSAKRWVFKSNGKFVQKRYKENPNPVYPKDTISETYKRQNTGTYTYKKGYLKTVFWGEVESEEAAKYPGSKTEIKGNNMKIWYGDRWVDEYIRFK